MEMSSSSRVDGEEERNETKRKSKVNKEDESLHHWVEITSFYVAYAVI